MARINIEIPDKTHDKLKILAIKKKKDLKELVPEILTEYIKESGGKK